MPEALAAMPRKILPPPMTTATSMSSVTTAAISRGEAFEDGGLDAIALLTGQHLSADFEEDAPVICRAHASPS